MATLTTLILLVLIVLLGCIIRLLVDVRALRSELLPDIRSVLLQISTSLGRRPTAWAADDHHQGLPHGADGKFRGGCFLIWEWQDESWKPIDLPAGVSPGPPPPYTGAFPGDISKTWVVLQPK